MSLWYKLFEYFYILPLSRPRLVPTHISIGGLRNSPEDTDSLDILVATWVTVEGPGLKVSHAHIQSDPSYSTWDASHKLTLDLREGKGREDGED